MTTIILVTIGVLLAALAALMVVFYGGSSFEAGGVKAEAATITSHLSQLQAAVELYEVQTGTRAQPGSLSYLTPLYMKSMPQNPAGPGWYYDARMADSSQPALTPAGLDLVVAGLPEDVHGTALCTAIARQNGTLGPDGAPVITSSAGTVPRSPIGCFRADGWGSISGVFVTYARVR